MHAYAKAVLESEEAKLSGEEIADLTSRCHSMHAHEVTMQQRTGRSVGSMEQPLPLVRRHEVQYTGTG
jgi:hypothetical protein